jgi:hypothetical protein
VGLGPLKLRTTRLKVEAGVTFTRGNQMGEDDAADEGSGQDKSDSVQGFVFPDSKRKLVAGQEIDSQAPSKKTCAQSELA